MVIIFDVDGTIFDTKKEILQSLNIVLSKHGFQTIDIEDGDKYIGPSFYYSLPLYLNVDKEKVPILVEEFRDEYNKIIAESSPFTEMIEIIKKLYSKGNLLCIATMKPRYQLDILLSKYSLSKMFVICKTKDGISGNKTTMLKDIKKELFGEDLFVMVGDTEDDYIASENAGMHFIYAAYGYGYIDVYNADKNIKSVEKAMDLLKVLA